MSSTSAVAESRSQVIGERTILEARARVGSELLGAIEPVYDTVDVRWLRAFAQRYATGRVFSADYICHRALCAASDVDACMRDGYPTFRDNGERAVFRAAERLTYVHTGELLLEAVKGRRGGIAKQYVAEISRELASDAFPDEIAYLRERIRAAAAQ